MVLLQKIDSKLDEVQILKGELPMEVKDLEDEIEGLHARQTRVEEEINGIQEFIEQKKEGIKEAQALIKKYEKQILMPLLFLLLQNQNSLRLPIVIKYLP